MWNRCQILALSLVAVMVFANSRSAAAPRRSSGYVQTEDCETSRTCIYRFKAIQQLFEDVQQNATVVATVEVSCDSVGTFNEVLQATKYCMIVKDSAVYMDVISEEESSGYYEDDPNVQSADKLLSGWFCFVQTEEGKVVAIYHSKKDHPSAVNFKKTIAAAFQANFRQSETEEEVDPQSIHKAHYSYTPSKDGLKMHRTVRNEDVVDYTSHIPKEDAFLSKEEDIEYRSGMLFHSSGSSYVKLLATDSKQDTEKDTLLADVDDDDDRQRRDAEESTGTGSRMSAHATYSLDLEHCYNVPRVATRKRRAVKRVTIESTLMAQMTETLEDKYQMSELRKKIPSVTLVLLTIHENPDDTKLADELQLLLQLESEYGPLPKFTPALEDVLSYLDKILGSKNSNDLKMRLLIYSLLSPESSLKSQMALLHSLEIAVDKKEENTLAVYIALISNPHPEFVSRLEALIDKDTESSDPLLLAYGALASKASPHTQQQILRFLTARLKSIRQENPTSLVHVLHSLGNSGSNLAIELLLGYVNSTNPKVQLAAIYALRKHTNVLAVQETFTALVSDKDVKEEQVMTVVQTLISGLEHLNVNGKSPTANSQLIQTLVATAVKFSIPKLHHLVLQYLRDSKTAEAWKYAKLLSQVRTEHKTTANSTFSRQKRGSDWTESSSLYDRIAPYSARVDDVETYPHHYAYLWGQRFGNDDVNADVAAGAFAGLNSDATRYKLFAGAVAKVHAFGNSAPGFDVQLHYEKTGNNLLTKVFSSVLNNVLTNVDYLSSDTLCIPDDWPIHSSRHTILSCSHKIFILFGFLRFSFTMTAQVDIEGETEVCITPQLSGSALITPEVNIRGHGSASASILALFQGGITIDADFTYKAEPIKAEVEVCLSSGSIEVWKCIDIYESWPTSSVHAHVWYQWGSIQWCGWIPCGVTWGSQQSCCYDENWEIPSNSRRYQYCDEDISC